MTLHVLGTLAPDHRPLNREEPFKTWPHFDPGVRIDTNPSFVRLGADDAWSFFCRYDARPIPGVGSIWAVRVDANMDPLGAPVMVIGQGIDPRVVAIGSRVLLFFSIVDRNGEGTIIGSSIALGELAFADGAWTVAGLFQLPKAPLAGQLPADSAPNWEKNWVPFAIDSSHVGLIYSHEPWNVITLNVEAQQAPRLESVHQSQGLVWDKGTIRGGSPPVRYDDDHLVTFFHASQVIGSRNVYSVGACVFMAKAPYTPVLQTQEPLLLAPYKSVATRFGWNILASVIFPMGAEPITEGYRLLCGRDDGEIASFVIRDNVLRSRLETPKPAITGSVHDYRGREGARLPLKSLLYVPDPIPGIPELPMVNFLKTIAGRGRTFVDVGAHIGFFSMGLAPGFRRVISFEPSNFQHGFLKRNRALNDYQHVFCEKVALGDQPGTATLNVLSYDGGLNTLSTEVAQTHAQTHQILDQYTVPVEVLDNRGMTDVDLMKIDVEGFEIPVLRGAVKTINASRPVILIEVWTDRERRQHVEAVMTEMNYTFEPIFPRSPELVLCLPCERRHEFDWFV